MISRGNRGRGFSRCGFLFLEKSRCGAVHREKTVLSLFIKKYINQISHGAVRFFDKTLATVFCGAVLR